jgi:hypothetical protein
MIFLALIQYLITMVLTVLNISGVILSIAYWFLSSILWALGLLFFWWGIKRLIRKRGPLTIEMVEKNWMTVLALYIFPFAYYFIIW